MKAHRHGIVVGKFAPLHLGHELLIRAALAACDRVTILSWSSPELPGSSPDRRTSWLSRRFPEARRLVIDASDVDTWRRLGVELVDLPANTAPDADHHLFIAQLLHRVVQDPPDAVFTSEAYGAGFAESLTSYFRAIDPTLPRVVHVEVDRARILVPASGTLLRSDIHGHRHFIAPEIYADFVQRICLVGGESTGKSTLAALLADRFETRVAAEAGRELWEHKGGQLEIADMVAIARTQVGREEAEARKANRFLFCDTSPLTTLFYSHHYFGWAEGELKELANRAYDLVFVCAPDFPHVQDGTREGPALRMRQHEWYLNELAQRGVRYMLLEGDLEERSAVVAAELKKLAP